MKNPFVKVVIATAAILMGICLPAQAHGHRWHGGGWVGPALVGGIVTYSLMTPRVVYAQPPIIYSPPPTLIAQNDPAIWYYCRSSQIGRAHV